MSRKISRHSGKILIFNSPPSRIQYIQKYIHSIMSTIVVRLPYILENPVNTSTYTENIQEIAIHTIAVN